MFPAQVGDQVAFSIGSSGSRKARYLECAPDNVNDAGRVLDGASYADGQAMGIERVVWGSTRERVGVGGNGVFGGVLLCKWAGGPNELSVWDITAS